MNNIIVELYFCYVYTNVYSIVELKKIDHRNIKTGKTVLLKDYYKLIKILISKGLSMGHLTYFCNYKLTVYNGNI